MTHATTRPHSCTQLVVTYDNMYAYNIYNMNLYFIRLHFSTRVAHGDTCSFVKLNYMVTNGIQTLFQYSSLLIN